MLGLEDADEAYYVCGIINAKDVVDVIDGYAISTNRGIDVLKYLAIPKFDSNIHAHRTISNRSKEIHTKYRQSDLDGVEELEIQLNMDVRALFHCDRH